MALTIILALITVISMVIVVLTKPYVKIGKLNIGLYWVVCLVGAVFMLIFGRISLTSVISGITADTSVNPLKILTLFLSMTLISVYLGDTGFFDYVANLVFVKTKGGGYKLFFILYIVVAVLTVFTSNDIIILTFTPPICIFAKKAKVSPLPYLFAEFIAANTWSMALIIGNPTNIYLAGSAGITFYEYLSVMIVPAIVGGITSLLMLVLVFNKQLKVERGDTTENSEPTSDLLRVKNFKSKISKAPMIVALIHLLGCIIMLAISDLINIEMYLICLGFALSLTIFFVIYDLVKIRTIYPVISSVKKAPYELVPFVLSMFVIVLALKESGVTEILGNLLICNTKIDALIFSALSTLSSNLLNNIPMSVLFEQIVNGKSLFALYGSIIGSNVGAFLTPVGALAGIMWSKILGKYDVKMSFTKFIFYGVIVAIPTMLLSAGALMLVI